MRGIGFCVTAIGTNSLAVCSVVCVRTEDLFRRRPLDPSHRLALACVVGGFRASNPMWPVFHAQSKNQSVICNLQPNKQMPDNKTRSRARSLHKAISPAYLSTFSLEGVEGSGARRGKRRRAEEPETRTRGVTWNTWALEPETSIVVRGLTSGVHAIYL